jgi:hypothetical protein
MTTSYARIIEYPYQPWKLIFSPNQDESGTTTRYSAWVESLVNATGRILYKIRECKPIVH